MKHTVDQTTDGIRITAVASPEKQQALLEEFAKCAAGTCSCQTSQYDKVESIDVTAQEVGVTVTLKTKTGESIDVTDIERCLDHTAQVIGG